MPVDRHQPEPGCEDQHSVAGIPTHVVHREPDLPDQNGSHSQRLEPGLGLAPDVGGSIAYVVAPLQPADPELQEEVYQYRSNCQRPPGELQAKHDDGGTVDDLVEQRVHEHAVVGDALEVHHLPPAHGRFLPQGQFSALPAGHLAVDRIERHAEAEADAAEQVLVSEEEVDHGRPEQDARVGDPVGCGEHEGERAVHVRKLRGCHLDVPHYN